MKKMTLAELIASTKTFEPQNFELDTMEGFVFSCKIPNEDEFIKLTKLYGKLDKDGTPTGDPHALMVELILQNCIYFEAYGDRSSFKDKEFIEEMNGLISKKSNGEVVVYTAQECVKAVLDMGQRAVLGNLIVESLKFNTQGKRAEVAKEIKND